MAKVGGVEFVIMIAGGEQARPPIEGRHQATTAERDVPLI
jgi:hypothetical protein